MRRTIKTLAATATIALPTALLVPIANAQTEPIDSSEAPGASPEASPDAAASGAADGTAAAETPPEPVDGNMEALGSDPADSEKSEAVQPYVPGAAAGPAVPQEAPKSDVPDHPVVLDFDMFFGFGNVPILGPGAIYTRDAFVFAPKLSARWNISRAFWLGVQVPWSTDSVSQGEGKDSQASQAWGAPQIQGQYNFGDEDAFGGGVRIGVGIPIAQGNADPTQLDTTAAAQNVVQELADAANGWIHPELYTPNRLPLSVSGAVAYRKPAYDAFAWSKMTVLFNTGSALHDPAKEGETGTYDLHSVGLRSVTQLGARYWFLDDYSAGFRANFIYNIVRPIDFDSTAATAPSRFQFSVMPELRARFDVGSAELNPFLGFMIPAGGQLGGHIWSVYAGTRALF